MTTQHHDQKNRRFAVPSGNQNNNKEYFQIGYALPYAAVLLGLSIFRQAWIAILLYHTGILIAVFLRRHTLPLSRLKNGFDWKWLIAGLLIFSTTAPIMVFLYPSVVSSRDHLSSVLSGFGLSGSSWIVFTVYSLLVNPILEESYWRGLLITKTIALSTHDLFFAGYHILALCYFIDWRWLPAALIAIGCASWLWRIMTLRLGGLLVPIATHWIADLAILLSTWLFLAGLF